MKLHPVLRRAALPFVRTDMPGFDAIYYNYWYRDVARFSAGPLAHYLKYGWKEGRDPSAGFSTSGYLAANPDVVASKICPLIHFLNHGLSEGRSGWEKQVGAPPPTPRAMNQPLLLLAPPDTKAE